MNSDDEIDSDPMGNRDAMVEDSSALIVCSARVASDAMLDSDVMMNSVL